MNIFWSDEQYKMDFLGLEILFIPVPRGSSAKDFAAAMKAR
jgi:hypothetical protein